MYKLLLDGSIEAETVQQMLDLVKAIEAQKNPATCLESAQCSVVELKEELRKAEEVYLKALEAVRVAKEDLEAAKEAEAKAWARLLSLLPAKTETRPKKSRTKRQAQDPSPIPVPTQDLPKDIQILRSLCAKVSPPVRENGRPPILLYDMVYSMLMKTRANASGQAVSRQGMRRNTIFQYFGKPEMGRLLGKLLAYSAVPLKELEPDPVSDEVYLELGIYWTKLGMTVGRSTGIVFSAGMDKSTAEEAEGTQPESQTILSLVKKLGDLRSRSYTAQTNEVLCKLLCHNISVLDSNVSLEIVLAAFQGLPQISL